MLRQRTLKSLISASGVGLHTGRKVRITLRPAPEEPPVSEATDRHPWVPDAHVVALPRRGPSQPQRLGPLHPARVLVVDDDERLRMLLRTTLEVVRADSRASVPVVVRPRSTARMSLPAGDGWVAVRGEGIGFAGDTQPRGFTRDEVSQPGARDPIQKTPAVEHLLRLFGARTNDS